MKTDKERDPLASSGTDPVRRAYGRPTMTAIGRLEDLTASGTGGIMEHGHGTSIYSQA